MMYCRGIRGATTADANTREAILQATREMLEQIIAANGLCVDDIASAIFSTTADLDAEFPAVAARQLGWLDTALFCTHEMQVPGSLPRCIRVLIHWNTTRRADEVVHVYIQGARGLRPERALLIPNDSRDHSRQEPSGSLPPTAISIATER
ncbi:MAG TPA: chorismate mutase [Roseiflexaceae bacterium]|nr:chorismate mutase [Roseiflexaceae bacterium]